MIKIPDHPHILLVNDDGIEAEGLRVLAEALRPHADLTIVAPRREQSGMAHAISVFIDLHLEEWFRDGQRWGWALTGTPVDCTKIGLTSLKHERPVDLVISGINRGQNAGINVIYSGTVAAAREAILLGTPALAMSLLYHDENELPYEVAAEAAVEMLRRVQAHGMPEGILLNVNVPPVPYDEIKGWCVTRMGNSGYMDHYEHDRDHPNEPGKRRNVGDGWIASTPYTNDTDDHAIMNDYVSITPLMADLTAHEQIRELKSWLDR